MGYDETFEGLEAARTYVYIGQSKNLRRRLQEHTVIKETNSGLRAYLQQNQHRTKFWFTTEVGNAPNSLNQLEKRLIRRFIPEFNSRN